MATLKKKSPTQKKKTAKPKAPAKTVNTSAVFRSVIDSRDLLNNALKVALVEELIGSGKFRRDDGNPVGKEDIQQLSLKFQSVLQQHYDILVDQVGKHL
tara:strand:- start:718 stop:1014 length:297 start_codon:yes stop_codon:yes gene_type:complete